MKLGGVIHQIMLARRTPPPNSNYALDRKFLKDMETPGKQAHPGLADGRNPQGNHMNINDTFPSKYLKASDLEGEVPAVISHISMEDIGQDDRKPVVYFRAMEKGVVLNKTNANNIAAAYGPETDDWNGKPVVLYTAWVDFAGKSTEAIRIRPDRPKSAAQPKTHGQPQMTNAPPRGAGTSIPPQFDDPDDPGPDEGDIR